MLRRTATNVLSSEMITESGAFASSVARKSLTGKNFVAACDFVCVCRSFSLEMCSVVESIYCSEIPENKVWYLWSTQHLVENF